MKIRREELADLLKRYSEGKCSDYEKKLVDSWFEDADAAPRANVPDSDMQEFIWQKIQHEIGPEAQPEPRTGVTFRIQRFYLTGIAASLLLAAGFIYYFLRPAGSGESASQHIHTETNASDQIKTVYLEDSSRVDLRPGCSISYSNPFEKNEREVSLTGEAFFEVTKDSARPFIVYSGEVATKVVGTSFLVRSGAERRQDVEVSVVTGKVIVERHDKAEAKKTADGVILTPNQKVTYYHNNSHFVTGVVEKPEVLKPRSEMVKTNLFRFDETPLSAVLDKLQYGYGIEFVLLNENIRNCPFTADLQDQPLYTKLDIITASLNAKYEVKGTRIVVTGGTCE